MNNEFASFLAAAWSKKSSTNRGLADNPADAGNQRKTAVQKNLILERMLGLVAQFAPSLLRNDIIKKSTSLAWIWTRIRKHYSFSKSEVNFLKLYTIHHKENERYEALFQRIISHLEDNLLTAGSAIHHDGEDVIVDEELTPTCERLAVFIWLQLINSRLPAYVSRVYAHDLQNKSLKDIQPQLADSMETILEEINTQENIQVQYSRSFRQEPQRKLSLKNETISHRSKQCILCKESGRKYIGHSIGSCWHLSKFEKLSIARSCNVDTTKEKIYDDSCDETSVQCEHDIKHTLSQEPPSISIQKVQCGIPPFFYAFFKHHPCHIIIDSGATSSLVSNSFVKKVGIEIHSTFQSARCINKSPYW